MHRDVRPWQGYLSRFFVIAGLLSWASPVGAELPPPPRSTVFYAYDTSSITTTRVVNPRVVRRMVDSLVCRITNKRTVAEAWGSLVSPKDIVGIKVAASGGAVSGTNPEVVDAIAQGLSDAGVPPRNIIVWDRNISDLLLAGYDKNSKLYVLQDVDPRTGYDPKAEVSAPVLGKLIWGDSQFGNFKGTRVQDMLRGGDQLSSRSFYAKVLSTRVTKVINVPSLIDSYMTGINGGIANMTLANLDNWRRFAKASAEGDSYLAEVYADPMIHDKVVLTLLDGLVLQYAGGPFPNPNFITTNFTLFASRDVVAIDATAIRLIDEMRISSKLPSVKSMTGWLEAGTQLGLGENAEPRIDMIRVGIDTQ